MLGLLKGSMIVVTVVGLLFVLIVLYFQALNCCLFVVSVSVVVVLIPDYILRYDGVCILALKC